MLFLNIIKSCIGVELLLIQLVVAVYLGAFYDLTNQKVALAAPLIWVMYPIVIGSIKSVQMKMIRMFDVEELYEFLSLNLGAFPYRFLYLGIDSYLIAALIIAIKFIYKTLTYCSSMYPPPVGGWGTCRKCLHYPNLTKNVTKIYYKIFLTKFLNKI